MRVEKIFEDDGNGETYQKGWLLVCLVLMVLFMETNYISSHLIIFLELEDMNKSRKQYLKVLKLM